MADLFKEIDKQLSIGHYVIVSLPNAYDWHMYVIYGTDSSGDYIATSKHMKDTIFERNVKKIIRDVQGTDIMVYEITK